MPPMSSAPHRLLLPAITPAQAQLLLISSGEFAELRYGSGNDFDCCGYFLLCRVAAEAETDRGAGVFGAEADGGEDVRRFDGSG